jgi:hypothetical protein
MTYFRSQATFAVGALAFGLLLTNSAAQAQGALGSQIVTWTCSAAPCPWGDTTSNDAVVWSAALAPLNTRLGYTTSGGAYLPANNANGLIVKITSGSASLYAGAPGASSHRQLATLGTGQHHQVAGLVAGEVLSVQSGGTFAYELLASLPPPNNPPPPPPGNDQTTSRYVTWTCTGSPCPWDSSSGNPALVWPASMSATSARLGYTTSSPVYLPASAANGLVVKIKTGTAGIYAGQPNSSSHFLLAIVASGEEYQMSGLGSGDVVSVQSTDQFSYELATEPTDPTPPDPTRSTDPLNPGPDGSVHSIRTEWHCNTGECDGSVWEAAVISWPAWSAYSNNARQGNLSRTTYSPSGQVLNPYMGSWADGCQVTAKTGTVLIIEWQRGTDDWRETYLEPGESHTINLVGAEDGALIETYDFGPDFSVKLTNCTPQPLP